MPLYLYLSFFLSMCVCVGGGLLATDIKFHQVGFEKVLKTEVPLDFFLPVTVEALIKTILNFTCTNLELPCPVFWNIPEQLSEVSSELEEHSRGLSCCEWNSKHSVTFVLQFTWIRLKNFIRSLACVVCDH